MRSLRVMLLAGAAQPLGAAGLSLSPDMPLTFDGLRLEVRLEPSADVLEALDAHVELPFRIDRRCGGVHQVARIGLRLRPLSADYVLRMADGRELSFRLRAEALAAFRSLTLPRPRDCERSQPEVRVQLELGRLPPPLRLPALLDRTWWLDSGWVSPNSHPDAGAMP